MLYTDGAMNVFCLYIFMIEILMLFIDNISFSIQGGLFHTLNFKHLILVIKESKMLKRRICSKIGN